MSITLPPLPRPGPLGLIQYAGGDMQEYAAAVSAAKDAEIAQLRHLLFWAYGKLAYRSFSEMDDCLKMDEIKLIAMDGL